MGKIALIVKNAGSKDANKSALKYYIGEVEDLDVLTDVLKEMTKAEHLNVRQSDGDIDALVYASEKAGADFSNTSGKTANDYCLMMQMLLARLMPLLTTLMMRDPFIFWMLVVPLHLTTRPEI